MDQIDRHADALGAAKLIIPIRVIFPLGHDNSDRLMRLDL